MSQLRWTKALSVGVHLFDEQHQKLFDMINALHQQSMNPSVSLVNVIDDMLVYVKKHFAAEEFYLKHFEYPDYKAHHLQHANFFVKALEFKKSFGQAGNDTAKIQQLAWNVLTYLEQWLINHIMVTDAAYESFFEGKYLDPALLTNG